MRFFRSRLFRWFTIFVSLLVVFRLSQSIVDLWAKRGAISEKQQELAVVSNQNEQLKEKLAEAQSPAYIEKIAREKLSMVQAGESIVLVSDQASSVSETRLENVSNWKKWWLLFF